MQAVTGKPVKLIGTGEKSDALEDFHPRRIADRILGMGDIVSLVEKAAEAIDAEQAAKMAKKMQKGHFDLEDLAEQLRQMEKLGGMSGMMGMLPGIGKMKKQIEASNIDDKMFKRQVAIIESMTPAERQKPELLKASRKKRIAAGSGMDVADVNKLLKMHRQMADMMKKMGKGKGMLGKLMGGLGGGGMPDVDPKQLEEMAKSGQLPGAWKCRKPARRVGRRSAARHGHAGSSRPRRSETSRVSGYGQGQETMSEAENKLGESPALSELKALRASIDNIDAALVHMLAERFKCTQKVGVLKATNDLPPADPAREKIQIERLRQLAGDANLDPDFAEKFLNFIVKEVIRHHEAIAAEAGN